jgi:capsular polysaccharide biosynthesis protein
MVRRRWLVALTVCVVGFGLLPNVGMALKTFKGNAGLLIVSEANKDTTLSEPDLPSILTSTEVLGRVIRRLDLNTSPNLLALKIKTTLPAKSSILEVTYQDKNAVKAATVTNAIADEAASYFHEIATHGYADVLKALNRRIAESQARVASIDRLLQHAYANDFFTSSERSVDDLTTHYDDLRIQRGQADASLAADRATAASLEKQLRNISPIVRGEILQKDVVYQQMQAGLARDAADLISEQSSFRDSFPGLSALVKRVDREREQLNSAGSVAVQNGAGLSAAATQTILDGEHAAALVGADRERRRVIDAQVVAERQHLEQVAGAGAVVSTLRAKREAALQQYIALTQRLTTAQGDAAQGASLGRLVVVSRALPGAAVLPPQLLVGIGALILVLALAAAYIAEALDRRLWGAREIESIYKRPVFIEVGRRS